MTMQLALVALLLVVGVAALGVFAQIWHRGKVRRRPALALIALASALYAFGYAIELTGDSVAWVFATYRVQYLGIAFAPTLLLSLAAGYVAPGRLGWLARTEWRWVAFALSATTLVIVVTNPWHDWFHVAPRMDTSGPFPVIAFERGVWYWAFQAYVAAAVLTANAVFLRAWRAAREPHRTQARSLFIASVIPWVGSLLNLSGVVPLGLDPMPFALLVTSVVLYRSVVRQGLADVAPIARDLVFERMGDAVVVLDPDGGVLDQNASAVALLGALAEGNGAAPRAALAQRHPELAAVVAALARLPAAEVPIDRTLQGDPSAVVIAGRSYSVRLVALRDDRRSQLGQVVVLRDITRYVQMESLLRTLATTDELTGIANRRHFIDLAGRDLERARRSGRPLTIVVFDLDRFKRVNDRHGHQAGDAVLRAVATTTVARLRQGDVVGRYGGEEFALCLTETDEGTAAVVAERLRAEIAAIRVPVAGGEVGVSASVGYCAVSGGDLPDLETLLLRADEAQYDAKAQGGDRVVGYRG